MKISQFGITMVLLAGLASTAFASDEMSSLFLTSDFHYGKYQGATLDLSLPIFVNLSSEENSYNRDGAGPVLSFAAGTLSTSYGAGVAVFFDHGIVVVRASYSQIRPHTNFAGVNKGVVYRGPELMLGLAGFTLRAGAYEGRHDGQARKITNLGFGITMLLPMLTMIGGH